MRRKRREIVICTRKLKHRQKEVGEKHDRDAVKLGKAVYRQKG